MKKALLALAVAATAFSASAVQYAVVGGYSNWKFEESTVLEQDGSVFKCTIPSLTSGFKIVDIEVSDWGYQWSTSEQVVLDELMYLDARNGSENPDLANMEFPATLLSVTDAVVTFDPSEGTLLITGTPVNGYADLWVTGSFCDWSDPGTGATVQMDREGGVYTATVDFGTPEEGANVEFKIAGSGWAPQYVWSSDVEGVFTGEEVEISNAGGNIVTSLTGVQTLVLDVDKMTLKVASEEGGVEGVEVEETVAPVYYNLQGVKVANPENGVYVVVRGAKVSKEVVK